MSATMHGSFDYGYSLDSISHSSLNDDGTYITISGTVVYKDDDAKKYTGQYTVVLVEEEDEEAPYKVVSWDLGELSTESGEAIDYYNGIPIGGESATVTGTIDANGNYLVVSTENYSSCNRSRIQAEIKTCHKEGVEFIEEIMNDASIHCTLAQLIE